jgi:hypothetical protein
LYQHNLKHGPARLMTVVLALSLVAMLLPSAIQAADTGIALKPGQVAADAEGPTGLAMADPAEPSSAVIDQADVPKSENETGAVEEPALPLKLAVSYYLLSDYIYRGVNFSEFAGEGREKPNHQVTTSINWTFQDFGTIGFDTFFEWYAAQAKLNPFGGGQNLQEVDYIIWWKYPISQICTDLTLGYQFYVFPNTAKLFRQDGRIGNNNNDRSTEWWIKLAHNDAWLWKCLFPDNEAGVLNPTFFLAQDVGVGAGAVWIELGISHAFTIPCVDNFTITPGYTIAFDGGYTKRVLQRSHPGHMRMAYQQLSLNMTYDLTPVLCLPKWAGTLSVSGLLYFNDAFDASEDDGSLNDEFWGGMAVNWGWGG